MKKLLFISALIVLCSLCSCSKSICNVLDYAIEVNITSADVKKLSLSVAEYSPSGEYITTNYISNISPVSLHVLSRSPQANRCVVAINYNSKGISKIRYAREAYYLTGEDYIVIRDSDLTDVAPLVRPEWAK